MREVAIKVWDDVEVQAGNKVEAKVTVTVGLDGQWTELDLCAENDALLREQLSRWLAAGRTVDDVPVTRRKKAPAVPGEKKGQWKVRYWEHGKEWGEAVRQFADANGLKYKTATGKYSYNRELRDAYAKSIGREDDWNG